MTNFAATLTPEQIALALSYIDRTKLDLNRQLTTPIERYAHSVAAIDRALDDPLITRDIGRSNLVAVRAYFTHKRIELSQREAAERDAAERARYRAHARRILAP